jgi:hypothetical protein
MSTREQLKAASNRIVEAQGELRAHLEAAREPHKTSDPVRDGLRDKLKTVHDEFWKLFREWNE